VRGDTGNVGFPSPTEAWICQASGTAIVRQYANMGYITGTAPESLPVCNDDPCHYFGQPECAGCLELCKYEDKNGNG
jgi:hypothetical protein